MSELSIHDLETQTGELLPERETLARWSFDITSISSSINATNGAEALQLFTLNSNNTATALQSITNVG
jgi:hypothetical protein